MKRSHLVLLVLAAVALAMATLVAAFYAVENWRGARALEQARRELTVAGESLDGARLIPPPVPDERNVAMIPLFARALDYRTDLATGQLTFGPDQPKDSPLQEMPYGKEGGRPSGQIGSWNSARLLPLERVREYYAKRTDFSLPEPGDPAADAILQALGRFAPELRELEDALPTRPEGRFPVDWLHDPPATMRLPHYGLVLKLVTTLRLRAVASLAAGRHEEASRDVATAFRLRAAIQPEPTLLAHLFVTTCDGLLLQPVWEGLAQRRWTMAELGAIQAGLRGDDLLADFAQVVRGERDLFMHCMMETIRRNGDWRAGGITQDKDGGSSLPRDLVRTLNFGPRGWIDASEANLYLGYQKILTEALDLKARRIRPERIKAIADERDAGNRVLSPTRLLTKLTLPVMESVLTRTARTQAAREQAEVACALERYFLDHGAYPDKLDALLPTYLERAPNDLVDGAPMRYVRTEDGRFRLYAVGWNGRDDGGTVAWPSKVDDTLKPDDKAGDWVWQYTPVPLPEEQQISR